MMLCIRITSGAPKVYGGLSSLREPVLASPVYSVTFLSISGCDHLCLFLLIFFRLYILFCRRRLSALCLNLNLDRMYSFDL